MESSAVCYSLAESAELFNIASESDFECIPALSEGRIEGLVYTTDIFKEVAAIALSPKDQGIALGKD